MPEEDAKDPVPDAVEPPSPVAPEPRSRPVPESTFPEVIRLKVVGAVLFALAGLFAFLPTPLLLEGDLSPVGWGSLALSAAGTAVAVSGLLAPALRPIAMYVGPGLLLAAAAAASPGASLESIPPMELAIAFAFGVTWLLAVEHMHAVSRFVELGTYVTRQRLTTFHLGNVVNHFQMYGVGLIALIVAVTAVVVVGVPWVFTQGGNEVLGRSVELNSVFGVALAAAIVFTLSALILVFVRSALPQSVEVERVAYSRDRMEEMLHSSRTLEDAKEGDGHARR